MIVYILASISCGCSLIAISILALRKSNRDALVVVLSIIGIVAGFIALGVAQPRNTKLLGIDYLGFIVAILAAFATLLLGMQLYNVFNVKEDAKKVEEAKEVIRKYGKQVSELEKK